MTYTERLGDFELWIDCEECDFEGLIYYNTKPPQVCSDKCRQRACRRRKNEKAIRAAKKLEPVTFQTPEHNPTRIFDGQVEITIVQLWCDCPRGIFSVPGNVQIGGMRCDLCDGEFTIHKGY